MVSVTVASVRAEPLPRKSYSVKDKREFVQAVNALIAAVVSHCQASQVAGLSHYYYAWFKKVIEKVNALEGGEAFVPH